MKSYSNDELNIKFISESIDSKDCVNVLIIETDPEIKTLYKLFFNVIASNVSYTFIDDNKIDSIDYNSNSTAIAMVTLNLIKQTLFDRIIIDIKAGSNDGIEIAKEIFKYLPQQRLIFTTTSDLHTIRQLVNTHALPYSIPILQKPFKLSHLLTYIHSSRGRKNRSSRFDEIKLTDHVLASYTELQEELTDAIDFIKKGINSNELNLVLIRNDMDIHNTVDILKSKGLSNADIFIEDKSLIVLRNEEWYMPDGKVDKHRIISQWYDLVNQSIQSGKKGLRAFCMMDCFFEKDYHMEVVDYERTLPSEFEIPFVPICAYRQRDLDCLAEREKKKLMEGHNHIVITR